MKLHLGYILGLFAIALAASAGYISVVGWGKLFAGESTIGMEYRFSWCLDDVLIWISTYEPKEATSTIELAMWKAKIEENKEAVLTIDERNSCRIDVPGPAKDAILQYLK